MNIKRRVLILLIVSSMIGLIACGNSKGAEEPSAQVENESKQQSETENLSDNEGVLQEQEQDTYTIVYKDVVFENECYGVLIPDCEPQCNEIATTYNETSDDSLYAFCLDTYNDAQREPIEKQNEIAVKTALENGLMVMPDYQYCSFALNGEEKDMRLMLGHCVIVGKMEDIERVFDQTSAINEYYWVVATAPRPDWEDIMVQAGADSETEIWTESLFFAEHEEEIIEQIGTTSQVTISVPVILPEQTSEAD